MLLFLLRPAKWRTRNRRVKNRKTMMETSLKFINPWKPSTKKKRTIQCLNDAMDLLFRYISMSVSPLVIAVDFFAFAAVFVCSTLPVSSVTSEWSCEMISSDENENWGRHVNSARFFLCVDACDALKATKQLALIHQTAIRILCWFF